MITPTIPTRKRKMSSVCVCVCVWNFSREVKLVPALPWQYLAIYESIPWSCSYIWFFACPFVNFLVLAETVLAGGPGPLCQAWSNEARHNGGCNLGRRVVYLQLHGHDEGDVQTLVMRAPSLVCVSSCCFPIRIHGTFIIMNLAQNVLYVLSKCVSCGGCPTRCHRAGASTPCNSCLGESMIGRN